MKKIAIMQPYFFPYLGYWQLIDAVDTFVVFDDVNYIKRGWINRNLIRLSNGETAYIRLPVTKMSQNRLICEHELSDPADAEKTIYKTLEYNYKKRPYYADGLKVVEDAFDTTSLNLADFLLHQIEVVARHLHFDTQIVRSSQLDNDKSLAAQEKIIDIVKLLGGDVYINAIGGKSLYQPERFMNDEIKLMFLDPVLPEYSQGFSNFVPSLSVLDALMNCSQSDVAAMARNYGLIDAESRTESFHAIG